MAACATALIRPLRRRLLLGHRQVRDSGWLAGFQTDCRGETSIIDPGTEDGLQGRQEANSHRIATTRLDSAGATH